MKQITIELQTGKRKVSVPQSWDEIDLQTFIRIETEFKYDFSKLITLFSIMTGIDMAPLERSEQKDLDLQLFGLFQFISKPPKWEDLDKPKKLVIDGKEIECRYDFKSTTLGQKLTIDQLIRDKPNAIEAMAEAIGVFLQPTIDGEFDPAKMKALLAEILKLSCKDAFGYAQFFFLHSKGLKRYGVNGWAGTPRKRNIIPKWREVTASSLSLQ